MQKGCQMTQKFEIECPLDNLPKTCIYSMDNDFYSQFYEANDTCICGSNSWSNSILSINVFDNQLAVTPKRIQRCVKCKKIRVSKLKVKFEKIIQDSKKLLSFLLPRCESEEECLYVLKNISANLQLVIEMKKSKDHQNLKEELQEDIDIDMDLKNLLYQESMKKNTYDNFGLN